MAQWSAQSTHNRLVTGSSPVRPTIQNNMNEIVNFLINFAVIYFLVRIAFTLFSWRLEKQIVHVESSVESQYMILDLEHTDNQYFCYDTRTKDFVCQGRDMAEIVRNFRLRYPDRRGVIYNAATDAVTELQEVT
jgi:uncharacterized protein YpmB